MKTKTYRVTFSRIGRSNFVGHVECFEVGRGTPKQEANALCEAIGRFARLHLMSRAFDVTCNLTAQVGQLGYGRFGEFTIDEVKEAVR